MSRATLDYVTPHHSEGKEGPCKPRDTDLGSGNGSRTPMVDNEHPRAGIENNPPLTLPSVFDLLKAAPLGAPAKHSHKSKRNDPRASMDVSGVHWTLL